MKVKVYITLKPGIHDPQGQAIQRSLNTLGFQAIQNVRVGKYLELDLADMDQATAEPLIKQMCEKLLANTVIENYRFEFQAD